MTLQVWASLPLLQHNLQDPWSWIMYCTHSDNPVGWYCCWDTKQRLLMKVVINSLLHKQPFKHLSQYNYYYKTWSLTKAPNWKRKCFTKSSSAHNRYCSTLTKLLNLYGVITKMKVSSWVPEFKIFFFHFGNRTHRK